MSDQLALIPIPSPWRPRRLGHPKAHWSRWRGQTVSCDDCVMDRATGRSDMDLLRALWRYEHRGVVRLVCSVHAARRWRR